MECSGDHMDFTCPARLENVFPDIDFRLFKVPPASNSGQGGGDLNCIWYP